MSVAGRYNVFEVGDDRRLPFVVLEDGQPIARVGDEALGLRVVAMLIAGQRESLALQERQR